MDSQPQHLRNLNNVKTQTRLSVRFTFKTKGPRGNKNTLQVVSFSCWLHKAARLQRRVLRTY